MLSIFHYKIVEGKARRECTSLHIYEYNVRAVSKTIQNNGPYEGKTPQYGRAKPYSLTLYSSFGQS